MRIAIIAISAAIQLPAPGGWRWSYTAAYHLIYAYWVGVRYGNEVREAGKDGSKQPDADDRLNAAFAES